MSNFTLVVINGENLNIYKQDTFSETIKKIVELNYITTDSCYYLNK